MSEYIKNKGYIYLIKMCDTKNRTIYKIGKSINFYRRYKGYNYAEILTFIISNDMDNDEIEIIKIFNSNCKLDKGREFFIAKNDDFVLKLFLDYFSNKINNNINNNIKINRNIKKNNINAKNTLIESVNNTLIESVNNTLIESVNNTLIESVNNTVIESVDNIVIKNDENVTLLERTCPNCKKVFNYSSRLKAHLEITIHCKKTSEEIESFFLQFKKQANFKCYICNNEYTKNHNLKRHINNSNCKFEYEKIEREREKQIEIIQTKINNLRKPII
jgi:hypothetical protein